MHSLKFQAYFKDICGKSGFQIEPRVINIGDAWIDKNNPLDIIKYLQTIPKGSLSKSWLETANLMLV